MTIPVNSGDIYTDVSSLRSLKREAASGSDAALEKTAEQFEALFLQMMLKSMRQATPSEGIFDSDQSRFYQEMFDQQIAIDLARKRQLGIADLLVRQLGGEQAAGNGPQAAVSLNVERLRLVQPAAASSPAIAADAAPTVKGQPPASPTVKSQPPASGMNMRFESPADFVEKLHPLAEKYGAELGVEPRVLLAQAALETGWGKRVSRDAAGGSSHNLFNIKADRRWPGPQAVVTTLEYENGKAVRQQAAFRAYPDYAASFADYVAFLKSSPRYQQALAQADDGRAFIRGLHEAGYATDPEYAEKVDAILARLDA